MKTERFTNARRSTFYKKCNICVWIFLFSVCVIHNAIHNHMSAALPSPPHEAASVTVAQFAQAERRVRSQQTMASGTPYSFTLETGRPLQRFSHIRGHLIRRARPSRTFHRSERQHHPSM